MKFEEAIDEYFVKEKTLDVCFNFGGMFGESTIIEIETFRFDKIGVFCLEKGSKRKGFIPWTAIKYIAKHSEIVDLGIESQKEKGKKIMDTTLKLMEGIS